MCVYVCILEVCIYIHISDMKKMCVSCVNCVCLNSNQGRLEEAEEALRESLK